MQPLRITAELAEHQLSAIDLDLPIDGPLAWAWMRKNYPVKLYDRGYGGQSWIDIDLSDVLMTVKMGGEWFYACSWAVFKPLHEQINYRHRRFDLTYAERYADVGRKGKVITAGGPFKTRRIPHIVYCVEKIAWFCVGDREKISELLDLVEYVGSHRGAGYGRVSKWTVEPWPEDWSIYGPEGRLMRAIPAPDGDRISSIRPPYWAPPKVRCLTPSHSLGLAGEGV